MITATEQATGVLSELIKRPSFSREEAETASYLTKYLFDAGVDVTRVGNNVLAKNAFFDASRPTLLLVSHHDTVKPNAGYTKNPFQPHIENGKLFGLGSNDAGGCLVALLQAFLHFYKAKNLRYNVVFAAVAEEEISGAGGIEMALAYLPKIDCAIVGEPTGMRLAVAERGLMVLDGLAKGKAGHAAREEGDNALYKALTDIEKIKNLAFEKVSELLGPVKISVTSIETPNKAHNVVPDECCFVVDVRLNELYKMEEVLQKIQAAVQSEVRARSLRLKSSFIALDHPLVAAGLQMGKTCYGSPTMSDKALLPCPALKMGPGDSARSHTADEFIYVQEIEQGINEYIALLKIIL